MVEKEEEPFRGWSEPRSVQWARCILSLHPRPVPAPSPCRPPRLSRAGRPEGRRREDTDTMTAFSFPVCSDHMYWAAARYDITFQTRRCEDGGGGGVCSNASLLALCEFRTLWTDRHTPYTRTGKRGPGSAHSPVQGTRVPPRRSPHPDKSPPGHLSSIL